ncbi:ATP-binding cassette domain-containing protein [Actinomadura sp. HBU206391]|uniref:ATP-binding cassette domain-containing protein n=1 Tax=Actinomadura sp. HBU206391 TaxID=2731692 RepID=UPI001650863C|nr:ATP-binding cassette domain-containing protein [Actinomadura sp. HBU206391]MBC6460151.1 ATP-binding cassette domain-containing protein [Actinomadura sp. HBU206391]
MGDEAAVAAQGLRKTFGGVRGLDGVDLSVATGSVLALVGPNGAGKTTTIRILTTLVRPDAGTARVCGHDVVAQAAAVRERIGLAGQYAAVDEILTGRENLVMAGQLYHLRRRAARHRAAELLESFGLAEAADRQVRTYSGGMRRRLDLAVALVSRPPVVFLDEPSAGLDPRSRLHLWETIQDLATSGTTVLLTSQYLEEAERLADRIAVIDAGRIIAEGTSDDLKARIGGDRVQLRLVDPGTAPAAAHAVTDLGSGPPHADTTTGQVTLPVRTGQAGTGPARAGVAVLPEIVRRLDAAGLPLADIMLRRPTLDDVFLTLTGHTGSPPGKPPADPVGEASAARSSNPGSTA